MPDDQLQLRRRSFGSAAREYDAHRPSYPDAAIDWALAPLRSPAGRLLDLAAGTGKLTASLVRRPGAEVVAVEPDEHMLAVLRERLPGVRALAGSAESIPLPDASVDAVLVGQAFHWFDPARAGDELARVLRPGGVLAGLWNYEDDSEAWVAGLVQVTSLDRRVPGVSQGGRRPRAMLEHESFDEGERREFTHSRRLTADSLIATLGTHSWALISSLEEREEVFARVRGYLAGRPELGEEFDMPLRTVTVRMLRR